MAELYPLGPDDAASPETRLAADGESRHELIDAVALDDDVADAAGADREEVAHDHLAVAGRVRRESADRDLRGAVGADEDHLVRAAGDRAHEMNAHVTLVVDDGLALALAAPGRVAAAAGERGRRVDRPARHQTRLELVLAAEAGHEFHAAVAAERERHDAGLAHVEHGGATEGAVARGVGGQHGD